jgi:branched-chain amino acid transport system ATP-binding protein
MTVLSCRDLCAGYGSMRVVRNVSLDVGAGEIVALLGPNGAGKTTTLLTLAGALQPQAGTVELFGRPTRSPLHLRARSGLILVPEQRAVFTSLTTAGNLRLGRGGIDTATTFFPELVPLLARRAGLLSGGEQQILVMARALATKPKILITDELSLGLAPQIVDRLYTALQHAATSGVAVLLVEQHTERALAIADRGYLMRRGEVVTAGTPAQLRDGLNSLYRAHPTALGSAGEDAASTTPPNTPRRRGSDHSLD